jgi:hypothetical protein
LKRAALQKHGTLFQASGGTIKCAGENGWPCPASYSQAERESVGAPQRRSLLGTASGTGSTHIVQLGPVRIEGFGEELAPKSADLGEMGRPVTARAGRGWQGVRRYGRHDESCLLSGDFGRAKRSFRRSKAVSAANY